MQKRIDFAFNIFGGVVTLLVLLFVITSIISQFQKKVTTSNGTQANIPAAPAAEERLIAFTSEQNGNAEIYTMHADGIGLTNITNNPARDVNPFWSPDGKYIAFESDRNGNSDIFIMNPDGGGLTQLTDDPGYDNFFSWSPDGKKIGYESNIDNDPNTEDRQLFIMSNDGLNKIALTPESGSYYFVGWSPDSQRVIFQKQQPNPDIKVEDAGAYIVDVDGGNQLKLTVDMLAQISWEDQQHFYGLILDNSSYDHSVWSIYLFNISGETPQHIASYNAPGAMVQGIFKRTYMVESNNTVRWYSLNGNRTSLATQDFGTACQQHRLESITSHIISPNERLALGLVYCSEESTLFYLENADGSTIKQLMNIPVTNPSQITDVDWSSDENYLLLTIATPANSGADLYLLDIEKVMNGPSSQAVQLTTDGMMKYNAAWQPITMEDIVEKNPTPEPEKTSSSERLLAFSSEQGGNFDIYTMYPDGSGLTNITNNPARDANPVWSPNGKRIAFTSNRNDADTSQIYLMDADGSKVTLLTKERAEHILPLVLNNKSSLWSPDGSKLLYLQYRYDTDWNLQSIDVNNGDTIYLATGRFDLNKISWSPDGRYVAYLKNDPQNTDEYSYVPDLYVVNADGSNSREIKKLIPADGRLFDYRWSKDSDSIIFMGYKDNSFSIDTIYEFNLTTNSLIQNFTLTTGAIDWHDGISLIRPSAKETTFIWQRPDGTSNSLQWGAACSEFNFGRSSGGNFIIGAVCPDQKSGFYWANSDGSIIKNLLTISDMTQAPGWIDWSPDDQYLATTVATPQNTSLYILNVEASLKNPSVQPVVVSVADEESFIPIAWQPMISEDLTETEPTPEPVKTSSHDDLIAFTAVNNDAVNTNTDIYTIRVDGSNLTNLTHDPAKDFNANDYAPVWSPDRMRIAFMSDRGGSATGNTNIFVMNPDGRGLTQLTHNPGYDAFLSWSPDGEQIIYFSSPTAESNAQGQLIVMNADGDNKTVLTPPGYYYFQSWSPDNQKIVYAEPRFDGANYQDVEIHVVDTNGKIGPEWFVDDIVQIHWEDAGHFLGVIQTGMETQAKWSLYRFGTDGSQVALASQIGPLVTIFEQTYVTNGRGGLMWYRLENPSTSLNTWNPAEKCEATGGLYYSTSLTRSPDQKHALAIIYCIEATWYFLMNEDSSEIEQLGAPMDGSMGAWPQWSPDGKYVSLFFLNKKGAHDENLSLIDIERMRNDPSASPIPLMTNAVPDFGMSEPLIASNEAEETPAPKSLDFSLTVYKAEKLAFFDVLEPSYLPAGYTLEGVAYDPWAQQVTMKYVSSQGNDSILIYQQRGDWLHHPDSRAYATPVPIGNMNGEFIQGVWIYESPDTTMPTWDPLAETYGLSWQNGEFVFSIDFLGGEGITPLPLDEFVAIAESLK